MLCFPPSAELTATSRVSAAVPGISLWVSQPLKLQSPPLPRTFLGSSSLSEMLRAAHFAIYLQAGEQQLGSWHPFCTGMQWWNKHRVGKQELSGDRSVSTVLGSHSEVSPVEGLEAL